MTTSAQFLAWCAEFHNSPDIINIRFWLTKYEVPVSEIELLAELEENDMTRNRIAKGKAPTATLLKELDPKTKQGKIIAFILDLSNSVQDVCEEFLMERHSLLTQLNVVSRTTGIGYGVAGDEITLVLPNGCTDPFEL